MLSYRTTRDAGFSLVEMMVAIVAGMVLIGATLTLLVSSLHSNATTISTTRLTQELRAVSQVIAREIRRAGSQPDSLARIAAGAPADALSTLTITSGNCIQFAYQTSDDSGATITNRAVTIALSAGQVMMATSADLAAPVACGDADTIQLSSPQLTITGLSFSSIASSGGKPQGVAVYLEGNLNDGPDEVTSISRRYTETVFVPSLIAMD